jgi:hypothetical protein
MTPESRGRDEFTVGLAARVRHQAQSLQMAQGTGSERPPVPDWAFHSRTARTPGEPARGFHLTGIFIFSPQHAPNPKKVLL